MLGRRLSDDSAVVSADVADYGLVESIPADPNRLRVDNAVERDDRHLRGAAADVEHHRAARVTHRESGPNRSRHRLFDQEHFACSGARCGFPDCASLDLRRPARHAHQYTRARAQEPVLVRLVNEVLQHPLGDGEVCNDAVLQRPNGLDVSRAFVQPCSSPRVPTAAMLLPPP